MIGRETGEVADCRDNGEDTEDRDHALARPAHAAKIVAQLPDDVPILSAPRVLKLRPRRWETVRAQRCSQSGAQNPSQRRSEVY